MIYIGTAVRYINQTTGVSFVIPSLFPSKLRNKLNSNINLIWFPRCPSTLYHDSVFSKKN